MGPADENLGTAAGVAHFHHVDLDSVALLEFLTLDALAGGEHGLGKLAVGRDTNGNAAVARLDVRHDAGEDLVLLGGELLVDDAPFRLANALRDDLLGLLGSDTAELLGLHRDIHGLAQFGAAADLLGSLQVDLMAGILHLVHHGLGDIHLDAGLLLIQIDGDVVLALRIVLPESGQHGLLDLVVHITAGNAFFLFDGLDCLKEFCVHL